jgi:hypothetical protein
VDAVKAVELAQTFDCRTPGCSGEARSKTGRHAYCLECRAAASCGGSATATRTAGASARRSAHDREGVWVATLHAGADLSEANLLHDIRYALGASGERSK